MKNVWKVFWRFYDIFAHILGHIVLAGTIIGGICVNVYILYKKDELYFILIEVIIILILFIIACLLLRKKRDKKCHCSKARNKKSLKDY